MNTFKLQINEYLNKETTGYYHMEYTRFGRSIDDYHDRVSEHIRTCKNRFNDKTTEELQAAVELVTIVKNDLAKIAQIEKLNSPVVLCVPRAKRPEMYFESQLYFSTYIKAAATEAGFEICDATRVKDTKTTHIKDEKFGMTFAQEVKDQPKPYPGIAKDTVKLAGASIAGRDVIVVDDVYTKNAGIDEDFVAFCLHHGAAKVVLYCVGFVPSKVK